MLTIIRRKGVPERAAEEVLQEVYLKAYLRLHRDPKKLETIVDVATWLNTIARNTAIDWLRRNGVRPEGNLAEPQELEPSSAESSPEDKAILRDDVERGLKALEVANLRWYRALIATVVEGKSKEEAAEELRISVNVVGQYVSHARGFLRALRNDGDVEEQEDE